VLSKRTAALLLELGRLAAGGGIFCDAEELRSPVKSFNSALLDRRMQRLLARVDRRRPQSAAELHALRIAVKKLRYAVEFFAPLYDAAKVKPFRDRLATLQDCLGAINDAHSMLAHARVVLGPESRLADCVAGWSARFVYEERARFRVLWRQYRRTRAFW
jgi:CHAD domain-containing protein